MNNDVKLPLEYSVATAIKIYIKRLVLFLGVGLFNLALISFILPIRIYPIFSLIIEFSLLIGISIGIFLHLFTRESLSATTNDEMKNAKPKEFAETQSFEDHIENKSHSKKRTIKESANDEPSIYYSSRQLTRAAHEEKVQVVGIITVVRPYTTKTNKEMGFVTMKDIEGSIELVLFPKAWSQSRDTLSVGRIVIVEGQVDLASSPPKILVNLVNEIIATSTNEIPESSPKQTNPTFIKPATDPDQNEN